MFVRQLFGPNLGVLQGVNPQKCGSPPFQRTNKFGPNKCLTINFLHCEFQLSMFSNSKVSFWKSHFGGEHFWEV